MARPFGYPTHADEQPDPAGHDGRGAGVVERDRGALDQHVAARLGRAGLGADGVEQRPGLFMPVVNGFTSMTITVLPASTAGKTHRSVTSRRASSPGNLRLAAL
jgi:hypothetical protein